MKTIGKYIIGLLAVLNVGNISAQHVEARLDSSEILIGDQIGFELRARIPAGREVAFPVIRDTVTQDIEVVDKTPIDTTFTTDSAILTRQLTITSFDTGYKAIPRFQFGYGEKTITDTLESEPLLLHVKSVKVDTTRAIKDIKGPMDAPLTFAEILPWILGALALLLILAAIWYVRKKKKEQKPVFQPKAKPKDPPHIEAMKSLEALKKKKLWQNGKIKEYYSELTHILRVYVERKFEIPAVESTSNEILNNLKQFDIDSRLYSQLEECMETSDMVKFARMEPLPEEHEKNYNTAVTFVEQTKFYGQQPEEEENQGKLRESDVE